MTQVTAGEGDNVGQERGDVRKTTTDVKSTPSPTTLNDSGPNLPQKGHEANTTPDDNIEKGGVTNEGGNARPIAGGDAKCTYVRGVCHLHGEGARKYFRPHISKVVGPDGGVTRSVKKKAYYQCDLGQRGRRRQPVLSFLRTTRNSDDNTVGYLGMNNDSVGQYLGVAREEQGNEMLDENCSDR